MLLAENVPTFVLWLEPSQALLLALLSVSEFIKSMTNDDSFLSRSLSVIFFTFAAISSDLRFW